MNRTTDKVDSVTFVSRSISEISRAPKRVETFVFLDLLICVFSIISALLLLIFFEFYGFGALTACTREQESQIFIAVEGN
jgi:hypothetical protein